MTVNFTTWKGITDGQTYGIPDPDVYLQDDWGDNKLTDRDGSGTTTHNGEEGVYRPEWTTRSGDNNPTVENEQLTMTGCDAIHTDINLNLDETITWELTNVNVSDSAGDSSDAVVVHLWAEQVSDPSDKTDGEFSQLNESYGLVIANTDNNLRLRRSDENGDVTDIISGQTPENATFDATVTRDSEGNWEVLEDGESKGTGQNTDLSNPDKAVFTAQDDADVDFDEYKVR